MGSCFVNFFCCEYNCIIFPAPPFKHDDFNGFVIQAIDYGIPYIKVQLKQFLNSSSEKVPYIQISSEASLKKKEIIMYFHGNAEDIFHSIDFVLPIFRSNEITIMCMQYPTYSCYRNSRGFFISDRIKSNSLQFHKVIQNNFKIPSKNIHIIGRSIGTGPATYLASKVECSKLILISPFDTIRKVSVELVGCIGYLVKNHFTNEEAILEYMGQLLVIHGQKDQVIHFKHGEALVNVYKKGPSKKKCIFVQPVRMSHNDFDIKKDIVNPIKFFLNGQTVDPKT